MADRPFVVTGESFVAKVNGCVNKYNKGMEYTVRDGELWDDLREKTAEWEKEGKIKFLVNEKGEPFSLRPESAKLQATITVKD